jgi:hypothetical protein
MANCMLCSPNWSDQATLADPNGDFASSYPVANLQTRFLRQYAVTNGLPSHLDANGNPYTARISGNFGKLRCTTAMALVNHNLSLSATVRLVLWTDQTRTTAVYDSGYQPAYPTWFDTLALRWEDPNCWSGQINSDLLGQLPAIFIQMVTNYSGQYESMGCQWYDIFVYDPLGGLVFTTVQNALVASVAGYLQFGRLYMASDWTPVLNFEYGDTSHGVVDPTQVNTSNGGVDYFNLKPKYREEIFTLKNMSLTEGVNEAFMLTWRLGISGDLLFIYDPANEPLLQQRSFIGRLEEVNALTYPNYGGQAMPFKIKELVA